MQVQSGTSSMMDSALGLLQKSEERLENAIGAAASGDADIPDVMVELSSAKLGTAISVKLMKEVDRTQRGLLNILA